jgi:phage portal protein BeeE
MSIPPLAMCRNLIVDAIVQMPLYRYRGDERLEPGALLTQPDPDTIGAATIGATVDDLLFHGRAYWQVIGRDPEGFPRAARWQPHGNVQPEVKDHGGGYAELKGYRIDGERGVVPADDVLRFDSPNPGVLDVGGPALLAALDLEQAARRLASVELPAGVIQAESGSDISPDDAALMVDEFQATRRINGIAYLQGATYSREQLSPADLQLVEARAQVATDCARLCSVPVSMIGASPTGGASAMLYANLGSQLALFVSSACAVHYHTIEATLSTPQATPRGQRVAFDVQAFLRSDPEAAAKYAIDLEAAGLIDRNEARALLGIPAAPSPDLQPGRV